VFLNGPAFRQSALHDPLLDEAHVYLGSGIRQTTCQTRLDEGLVHQSGARMTDTLKSIEQGESLFETWWHVQRSRTF
jgi:hypothetical protein